MLSELYAGKNIGSRSFIEDTFKIDYTIEDAEKYGELYYRLGGTKNLKTFDTMIAAQVILGNDILLTNDKDFNKFKEIIEIYSELEVENSKELQKYLFS